MGTNIMRIENSQQLEELEREHYQRIQLGFKPEAPPPDLANIKPKISTRHEKRKYVKKPTKSFPHHREFAGDQFWPPTPPPPIEQNTPEKSELVDRGTSALRLPIEATEAEEEPSEMQQKDEFFNSEMEPKEMTSSMEDAMQPRGQRPTASATTSCLLNEVSEGIYVGETPLPMEEEDDEQGYELEDVR